MALSKKQDEHHLKVLRDLLKLPENRQCFDCPQRAPIYANMLNNTFVCEQCSGLHRELTHRIKSISASRFTFPEIQALRNGGNQKAAAIWMAKWDEKKDKVPAVSDVILMRKYLRYKYVERRWMSDAHSHLYEPAPTARFLDSSSITTTTSSSSSSSSAMVLAKDSNATRHSSSTQNDMSIERLPSNSRSSHGNSNDTNTKAIAIRHLSPPDSNSHKKPGILQVNSPNSITIFDRYNAASNDTDPYKSYLTRDRSHSDASTRRSGYSVGSQVDEDDIRNSPRTGGSGNGRSQRSNELTVVTRNYLRDMKPITNELTSSPTSERDHTSRRDGSRRELDFFNNNINYDDEPIDEFFEIMRERVSEQRRTSSSETSSIRSGGNGGGSINNPFSKRQQQQQQQQQGNDGSSIPSASSSDTHASTTIPTPDGQLITFADSPQPIRPEIAKAMGHVTTTSIAGKSSFDSLHGHPTRPNIAALQRNTIASLQRSASMPSVPRIALTNSNANTQMVEGYLHSTSAGLPASPTTMTGPSSTYQHPSTQSLTVVTSSIVHNNGNNGNNGMMHVMNNNSAWQSASPTTMTPTSMNGVINNPFMTVPSTSTTLNGMNQRLPMSSAPVSPVHDYGYHHTGHVMNNNHNSIYNYPSTMSQASTSSSPSLLVQSPSVVYSPRAATLPYPTANTTTMMVNNTATTTTTSTPTNNNLTNNNPFLFNHMRDALTGPSALPSTNGTKIYASSPVSQSVYGQPSF